MFQVDLTLDVEKALPLSVQRNFIKMEESVFPNEERSWNLGSFWTIKSPVSAPSGNNMVRNYLRILFPPFLDYPVPKYVICCINTTLVLLQQSLENWNRET